MNRVSVVCVAALGAGVVVGPAFGLTEDFSTDPFAGVDPRASIDGDASRVSWSTGAVTVDYDTREATTKVLWPLGVETAAGVPVAVNEVFDFSMSVDFEIDSTGFFADPYGFAQIAFGLVNSATTGNDRAGGGAEGGDAYDIATFDYFPNESPFFASLTATPTVIGQEQAGEGFFDQFSAPFGSETVLGETAEQGPLPLDTPLTVDMGYDGGTRTFTLTVSDDLGPLAINAVGDGGVAGGGDGDITTIQHTIPEGLLFDVDSFAILLWEDTYDETGFDTPGVSSVTASVAFTGIEADASVLLGDFNGDGNVDGLDIDGFVDALSDTQVYQDNYGRYPVDIIGDFNGDGEMDGLDIDGFVAQVLLPATEVPEPVSLALLAIGSVALLRRRG